MKVLNVGQLPLSLKCRNMIGDVTDYSDHDSGTSSTNRELCEVAKLRLRPGLSGSSSGTLPRQLRPAAASRYVGAQNGICMRFGTGRQANRDARRQCQPSSPGCVVCDAWCVMRGVWCGVVWCVGVPYIIPHLLTGADEGASSLQLYTEVAY